MNHLSYALAAALLIPFTALANPPGEPSPVFERVFGRSRLLDPALVEQVKALPPGERLEFDRSGDGRIDELWYLDTDKRHTIQPLLVVVVDEDGDMHGDGRGDRDSDLYFYDHHANGWIDCVVDYQDDDGDNDVDQMGIFYDKKWPDDQDDITVWWAVDVGDDNLLWYDVNGNYYQDLCQWRTHFSGDELFYQFRLTMETDKWLNVWEDPFAFYDHDGDWASEEVVRISSIGHEVQNLRYSMDVDDDAGPGNVHNYDFSVTALPGEAGVSAEAAADSVLTIRGIETHPVLSWEKTRDFGRNAPWGSAMLTWDEINSNTDKDVAKDPNERWEGILNHASKHGDFPQVGGPPSSPYNKRVEVSHSPASPLQLYFDEADQRFHLLGAKYGYMDVDYNFDGEIDAAYVWEDEDGDGILDVLRVDVNANGTVDFEQRLGENIHRTPLERDAIMGRYLESIERGLADKQEAITQAMRRLGGNLPESVQEVIDFYAGPLAQHHPEREVGLRIQGTPAGARFYVNLVWDRLFALHQEDPGQFPQTAPGPPAHFWPLVHHGQTYTRRIPLQVSRNTGTDAVLPPRVIRQEIAQLRKQHPDFNADNCVVVDGDFYLAWRAIPHQLDSFDFGSEGALVFQAEVPPPGKTKTYYLYYAPEGRATLDYPQLTNAVLDNPGYVAWESDRGAFRFYTGQYDFFGLNEDRMLPREQRLIYPLIGVNYHEQQDWGIDALHVGKTSGLGGLTLYLDGKEYPVQSPADEGHVLFEHRILGTGPVRSAVEILAKGVFPEAPDKAVTIRCIIEAGHPETEIQVRLPEGYEHAQLAPGLMNIEGGSTFETRWNCIGVWGRQGDDIGDIGMALKVFATQFESGPRESLAREILDLPHERRLLTNPYPGSSNHLNGQGWHHKYWILGAWRRGMQYPIAPTPGDWQRSVELWERQFHVFRGVGVHSAETVPNPK